MGLTEVQTLRTSPPGTNNTVNYVRRLRIEFVRALFMQMQKISITERI